MSRSTTAVGSPVAGAVVAMSEVPDPVFAEAMVGPGLAVEPGTEPGPGTASSPVAGTVATVHPHAFVVVTTAGPAVLVHLGIDTVKLAGDGFTLLAAKGDTVAAGQPMVEWDPAAVRAQGYSAVCPVVVLDAEQGALEAWHDPGPVARGDTLFTVLG